MKYNREFKTIDNANKAYLLGFMYGDGSISNNDIKLSVSVIDRDLILDLKEVFPFFNVGEFDYGKYNVNSNKQIYIRKKSKFLREDLISNGLYERKSYDNKELLLLPDIDDKYMSHFIRGFFDADGSAYILTARKNLLRIDFSSASKNFIIALNSYLKKHNIHSWKVREKKPTLNSKSKQTLYVIEFIKSNEVLKLIDFIYKNADLCLKRKANMCLSYKLVDKVKDRNINCPNCDYNKPIKNGKRNNHTRFKCPNCKKNFQLKKL